MACRRINKLKKMIVLLIVLLVSSASVIIKLSNGKCESFGGNEDYDKELTRFIAMDNSEQQAYLNMTRAQKIDKYGMK